MCPSIRSAVFSQSIPVSFLGLIMMMTMMFYERAPNSHNVYCDATGMDYDEEVDRVKRGGVAVMHGDDNMSGRDRQQNYICTRHDFFFHRALQQNLPWLS